MIKIAIIIGILAAATASVALAQMYSPMIPNGNGPMIPGIGGPMVRGGPMVPNSGSSSPPTCSNSLDFTQACNSQYAGVF